MIWAIHLYAAPSTRAICQWSSYYLSKGANAKTADNNGITPLHLVAYTDNVDLASLLIKAGADVNAKDKYSGFTPLDYAQDNEPKMIELLEQHDSRCSSC
jgi:ankyrin repeat protein